MMQRLTGKRLWVTRLVWVSTLMLVPVGVVNAEKNVHFYGTLIAEACIVSPGQDEIMLDFSTIQDRDLYQHQRTGGQQFALYLSKCGLSIGKDIKVKFTGERNTALPGLLALGSGSLAQGIAIGLETVAGEPLLLGTASKKFPVEVDDMVIALKAYVQGEPQAIAQKKIERGNFTASATFSFEYE